LGIKEDKLETKRISKELKIATVGYGIACDFVKRAINEAIEKDMLLTLLKSCNVTEEEYKNQMNSNMLLADDFKALADSLIELQGIEPNEPSIDQLKKQIKYSKNPLEVKILNKKINKMYKDMKRK
jgi:hypothetical protein